jgi:hypothetical protein
MEVRGSENSAEVNPQILTLSSPLGRERRINAAMQAKRS